VNPSAIESARHGPRTIGNSQVTGTSPTAPHLSVTGPPAADPPVLGTGGQAASGTVNRLDLLLHRFTLRAQAPKGRNRLAQGNALG